MINAVIFDFDGLLVDTEPIYYETFKELLNLYDIPFDLPTYVSNHSGKTIIGNIQTFIDMYHLPISAEDLLVKEREIEKDLFSKHIPLKKGGLELLQYLKENGYAIALATSSYRYKATAILQENEIYDYFDAYVFAEDVTKGKPDPQVFLQACKKLQEDPFHCLVLEDSDNGILAAHNANIRVICVPDLKQPSPQAKEYCVDIKESLFDIPSYLEAEQ